jgi:hypothetical protein
MRTAFLLLSFCCTLATNAQIQRKERKSLLDSEPGVVYLERCLEKPLELKVVKEAPVFSDREGKHRLGTLKADQKVRVEAITDKTYRVRGQGTRDGIAGWVAPWAFQPPSPDFHAELKQLYDRQIQVQALIEARQVAVGMTLGEVEQALGNPVKTSIRKTEKGQSGTWEYIDYEEVKHYVTRVHPTTGATYRQLSHIEQVERGRTNVEFADHIVTAVEQSEDRRGGSVKIIVPPVVFGW